MSSTVSKILFIYGIHLLCFIVLQCTAEEACETIPTEIHVTKGKVSYYCNNIKLWLFISSHKY